jgi:hypothetical protein
MTQSLSTDNLQGIFLCPDPLDFVIWDNEKEYDQVKASQKWDVCRSVITYTFRATEKPGNTINV